MLDVILSKVVPGGVWYFNELLPVGFPGHWLYHAMPATWAWVKKNTLSLHAFYNHLQAECGEIKIKRHVYSQSISREVAMDVLQRNPRVVRAVSEEALAPRHCAAGGTGIADSGVYSHRGVGEKNNRSGVNINYRKTRYKKRMIPHAIRSLLHAAK